MLQATPSSYVQDACRHRLQCQRTMRDELCQIILYKWGLSWEGRIFSRETGLKESANISILVQLQMTTQTALKQMTK